MDDLGVLINSNKSDKRNLKLAYSKSNVSSLDDTPGSPRRHKQSLNPKDDKPKGQIDYQQYKVEQIIAQHFEK